MASHTDKFRRRGHASLELLLVIMWIFGFSFAALQLASQQRWALRQLVTGHRDLFAAAFDNGFIHVTNPFEQSMDHVLRVEAGALLAIDRYPRAMPRINRAEVSPPLPRGVIPLTRIQQRVSGRVLRPAWTWNGPSV